MPACIAVCWSLQTGFVFSGLSFFWLFPRIKGHAVLEKVSLITALVFFQKQPVQPETVRQNEVTLPVGLTSVAFMLRSVVKPQNSLLDQQQRTCGPQIRPAGYVTVTRGMLSWATSSLLAMRTREKLPEKQCFLIVILWPFPIWVVPSCAVSRLMKLIGANALMLLDSEYHSIPGAGFYENVCSGNR